MHPISILRHGITSQTRRKVLHKFVAQFNIVPSVTIELADDFKIDWHEVQLTADDSTCFVGGEVIADCSPCPVVVDLDASLVGATSVDESNGWPLTSGVTQADEVFLMLAVGHAPVALEAFVYVGLNAGALYVVDPDGSMTFAVCHCSFSLASTHATGLVHTHSASVKNTTTASTIEFI